jgi:excinuclease ABC subunit C
MTYDLAKLDYLPEKPGVYIMKDSHDVVLYVGKAKNLKGRVKQYFAEGRDEREMVPFLISKISQIDTIVTPSEKEALLLENSLIKHHQPKYNVLLKDDKTFVSLWINTQHAWPTIHLVRYKNKPTKEGLYFGPYISATHAKETYDTLLEIFPVRQCSDEEFKRRKRPCLLYGMKKCMAPCVQKCSKEEYHENITHMVDFLKGQTHFVTTLLEEKMEEASELLEYEKAGRIHRSISRLKEVSKQGKSITHTFVEDLDAIGYYRHRDQIVVVRLSYKEGKLLSSDHYIFSKMVSSDEDLLTSLLLQLYQLKTPPSLILLPEPLSDRKILEEILSVSLECPLRGEKHQIIQLALENAKALLEQHLQEAISKEEILLDLQEKLSLERYPVRIECIDTSHISKSDPVASLVAFTNGEKDTKRYRSYKIQKESEDYASMKEVLTRRLLRGKKEEDFPDLLIVDGGKGQLGIALEILKELEIVSIDVIALTKDQSRHDKGLSQEKIYLPEIAEPLILDRTSALLFFLQNIRDEAHRRAIGYHKNLRGKRIIKSKIDEIPGIGPKKKRLLLTYFGSYAKLQKASFEELKQVEGIHSKDIESILSYFKNPSQSE